MFFDTTLESKKRLILSYYGTEGVLMNPVFILQKLGLQNIPLLGRVASYLY
uniref:Uncharacterized protein n=1 Tax=Aegilops tauschii subsp. strangulata TaxID=200361 RepID=A0A453JSD7_AEGTS